MKLQNLFFLSLLLALIFASCSTTQVISDFERGTDFSQYKTFGLVTHYDGFPTGANPINKQRIERAIQRELMVRGYQQAEDPDLLVAWFVKVEVHEKINLYRDYYGRWGWRGLADVNWYQYKVGTLVIDLIDTEKNLAVWHGAISGPIEENVKNVEEKINTAVRNLFERYQEEANQAPQVVP